MRTSVDQLLSLSRLPFHFWTDLFGGRPHWENPGSSILSYAVTKVSHELVDVPVELHESLQQCTDFTTKPDSLGHIVAWLGAQTTKAIQQASALHDTQKMKVFVEANSLMREWSATQHLFETLAGSSGTLPPHDPSNQLTKMFSQSLIDTRTALVALEEALKSIEPPKELA